MKCFRCRVPIDPARRRSIRGQYTGSGARRFYLEFCSARCRRLYVKDVEHTKDPEPTYDERLEAGFHLIRWGELPR